MATPAPSVAQAGGGGAHTRRGPLTLHSKTANAANSGPPPRTHLIHVPVIVEDIPLPRDVIQYGGSVVAVLHALRAVVLVHGTAGKEGRMRRGVRKTVHF
jgi:hypothetical protein